MTLWLRFLNGPRQGDLIAFEQPSLTLGRGADQQLVVPDPRASRAHARLELAGGRLRLADLDSTNGTLVNGRVAAAQEIAPGDEIVIGDTRLRLELGPPPRQSTVELDPGRETMIEATLSPTSLAQLLGAPSYDDHALLRREHRKLLAVYQVMGFIASVPDMPALMQRILDLVFEVVRADRGHVLVLDPRTGELEPLAWKRSAGGPAGDDRLSLSRTMVRHVLDHCQAIISADATSDARFAAGESVADLQIRSAMCVPIRTASRIWGVIHLDTALQSGSFQTDDLELVTAIGQAAGMAVENSELLAERLAQERLATIGKAIASLSHYIKNVLHGMRAGISLVEMGLDSDSSSDAREGAAMVRRYERRVSDLVLNMLDYSKDRRPDYRPVSVNELLVEAAELARARAEDKPAELTLELDGSDPVIEADQVGLHRALLNVALNAVDSLAEEGGRVTLRSEIEPGGVRLEIEDDGCGIPAAKLPVIFDMFYSTKGHLGTGIGLAVTRKIIEEHRGRIEVESQVGAGTRFILHLPASAGSPGTTERP